jgi:hypothetical protein
MQKGTPTGVLLLFNASHLPAHTALFSRFAIQAGFCGIGVPFLTL